MLMLTQNYTKMIALSVCIVSLIGAIGIPRLMDNIEMQEEAKITASLEIHSTDVINRINANITGVTDNMYLMLASIDALTDTWNQTGYLDVDEFQTILRIPMDLVSFSATSLVVSRPVQNIDDYDLLSSFYRQYYNVSNFSIIQNIDGRVNVLTPNESINTHPAYLTAPYAYLPAIPNVGATDRSVIIPNFDSVLAIPDAEPIMVGVLETTLIDGTLERRTNILVNGFDMIASINFNLDMFLDNILVSSEVVILVSDSRIGTYYHTNNYQDISPFRYETNITVGTYTFHVTVALTNTEVARLRTDAKITVMWFSIGALCVLFVGMIVIIWTIYLSNMRASVKNDIQAKKRLEITTKSNSIVIHEMRNLLNALYVTYSMKEPENFDKEDIITTKLYLDRIYELITKILDYESLLAGNFVDKQTLTDVMELTEPVVRSYVFHASNITYSANLPKVLMNSLKYQELLQNGLNNAIRYANEQPIVVRIQLAENRYGNFLLTEVINRFSGNFMLNKDDVENLFIPFFIADCDHTEMDIWNDVRKRLQLDHEKYSWARNYFGTGSLGYDISYPKKMHIEQDEIPMKTTGLGLSISRLLAKALGGECGLEQSEDYVRYWFILRCEPVSTVRIDDTIISSI